MDDISLNLRFEGFEAIKASLSPEPADKSDPESLSVEIPFEAQQVRFHGPPGFEGRALAQVGDGREDGVVDFDPEGVHAIAGQLGVLAVEVRRGKSEGAPSAMADNHGPIDVVVAIEEPGRVGDMAVREQAPDPRGGDRFAVLHKIEGLHFEIPSIAEFPEGRGVASAAFAEAKVRADKELPAPVAVDEHLIDKGFGAQGGELPIEALAIDHVDAGGLQQGASALRGR